MHPRNLLAALSALILLTSCLPDNKELKDKYEYEAGKYRSEIKALNDSLRKANTALELEKASRARAEDEIKSLREKSDGLRRERDATRNELLEYRRDYQLQSRIRAVGQHFDSIATLDGKSYRDATIRAVLTDSVHLAHADGLARIRLADLGPKWLKRFDVGGTDPICLIDEATLKEACAQAAKAP